MKSSSYNPRHQNNVLKISKYICDLCRDICMTKKQLEKHLLNHISSERIVEHSSQSLIVKKTNHVLSHTKNEKVEEENDKRNIETLPRDFGSKVSELLCCDQCSYSTTQKSLLRSHKQRHSSSKPFTCSKCGVSFKRKFHLTRHELSHDSSARKLKCPHCPYTTHHAYTLKKHTATHQTDKPIKCSLCPYSCQYEWTLKVHMRKHNDNPAPVISGKPAHIDFTCHLCGYHCDNTKKMRYHMARHDNKTPHACPHCDYRSVSLYSKNCCCSVLCSIK